MPASQPLIKVSPFRGVITKKEQALFFVTDYLFLFWHELSLQLSFSFALKLSVPFSHLDVYIYV